MIIEACCLSEGSLEHPHDHQEDETGQPPRVQQSPRCRHNNTVLYVLHASLRMPPPQSIPALNLHDTAFAFDEKEEDKIVKERSF